MSDISHRKPVEQPGVCHS